MVGPEVVEGSEMVGGSEYDARLVEDGPGSAALDAAGGCGTICGALRLLILNLALADMARVSVLPVGWSAKEGPKGPL